MNEELVEAMQNPQDSSECDPTSAQDENAFNEEFPHTEPTKRGETDEEIFEKAVEDPILPEDPDQDSDPDRGAAFTQEGAIELERLRSELTHLQEEISKRDMRLEQISKEFEEFNTLYPNISLSTLQDSVWSDVRRGIPIAAAYALAQRREEHIAQKAALSNLHNQQLSSGALQPVKSDYFSPDEVRAMSQSEVRANYQKIIQSMEKWR